MARIIDIAGTIFLIVCVTVVGAIVGPMLPVISPEAGILALILMFLVSRFGEAN